MGFHERVYLVEDDEELAPYIEASLQDAGHIIVGHSKDLETALSGIKGAREQGATVVVVDGNDGEGTW